VILLGTGRGTILFGESLVCVEFEKPGERKLALSSGASPPLGQDISSAPILADTRGRRKTYQAVAADETRISLRIDRVTGKPVWHA